MIPPRFHFAHLLLGDAFSPDSSCSFAAAIAEHATITSMASYNTRMADHKTSLDNTKLCLMISEHSLVKLYL
jgi:hypothetical protein